LSLCKQFLVINNKNKNSKRSTSNLAIKRRDREGHVCIRIAFS